jgi:hypothetical protein
MSVPPGDNLPTPPTMHMFNKSNLFIMATLKFSAVSPETTKLEDWHKENGRFANVERFGLTAMKDWFSSKGNQYVNCESKAFVSPGQFVRILQANPNAKWGRITEIMTEKLDENGKPVKKDNKVVMVGTGKFDLELFSDSAEQPEFMLDKDGLCSLLD